MERRVEKARVRDRGGDRGVRDNRDPGGRGRDRGYDRPVERHDRPQERPERPQDRQERARPSKAIHNIFIRRDNVHIG